MPVDTRNAIPLLNLTPIVDRFRLLPAPLADVVFAGIRIVLIGVLELVGAVAVSYSLSQTADVAIELA